MKNIRFLIFPPPDKTEFSVCLEASNVLTSRGHEVEFRVAGSGMPHKGSKYFDVAIVHESAPLEERLAVYGLNRQVIVLTTQGDRKNAAEVGPWIATPANILEVIDDVCADFSFVITSSGKRMTGLLIQSPPSS